MTILTPAAAEAVARWTDPDRRPLFKGNLIDWAAYQDGGGDGINIVEGCACAQGDILLHNGFTPNDLHSMQQSEADAKFAELLGISISHGILVRNINDKSDGFPENVLTNPESVLGEGARYILGFWLHLDRMTDDDWRAAREAWEARAAWAAWAVCEAREAWEAWAAWAAWEAREAREAREAWAAWDIAYAAMAELGGAKWLPEHAEGKFVFLPMFGFADPEAVLDRYPQFRP